MISYDKLLIIKSQLQRKKNIRTILHTKATSLRQVGQDLSKLAQWRYIPLVPEFEVWTSFFRLNNAEISQIQKRCYCGETLPRLLLSTLALLWGPLKYPIIGIVRLNFCLKWVLNCIDIADTAYIADIFIYLYPSYILNVKPELAQINKTCSKLLRRAYIALKNSHRDVQFPKLLKYCNCSMKISAEQAIRTWFQSDFLHLQLNI